MGLPVDGRLSRGSGLPDGVVRSLQPLIPSPTRKPRIYSARPHTMAAGRNLYLPFPEAGGGRQVRLAGRRGGLFYPAVLYNPPGVAGRVAVRRMASVSVVGVRANDGIIPAVETCSRHGDRDRPFGGLRVPADFCAGVRFVALVRRAADNIRPRRQLRFPAFAERRRRRRGSRPGLDAGERPVDPRHAGGALFAEEGNSSRGAQENSSSRAVFGYPGQSLLPGKAGSPAERSRPPPTGYRPPAFSRTIITSVGRFFWPQYAPCG